MPFLTAVKPLRYPHDWIRARAEGRKLTVLTAYDATMARLLARSKVDALLVGDSLGMIVQGKRSTLQVTLAEMMYHTRMVRRGAPDHFVIADLPFASFQTSRRTGVENGLQLLKKTEASAIKLEGANRLTLKVIRALVDAGVPVMGHIGLEPQSYLTMGGFRVQRATDTLLEKARALEEAGCFALVLELIERKTAEAITAAIQIPTIGIGSGPGTSGQVLVTHDILGLDPDFRPRHTARYANLAETVQNAANQYVREVEEGIFPGPEQSFSP
ncbi:MAG: 3-methyl-2-oxobutanoate hydroxymethyltransferase [Spirochaetales bacterium]|nr:3-methyl-2-oxobutanoate hydroxymethyltransferase [Spirochaetales bacterium]